MSGINECMFKSKTNKQTKTVTFNTHYIFCVAILSMEEVDLNESDAQSKKECCEKIDVRLVLIK